MRQTDVATCSVTHCVLILDTLDTEVILRIRGYNIATKIYIEAFMGHKLRFYNILFLPTFVLFGLFPKEKILKST